MNDISEIDVSKQTKFIPTRNESGELVILLDDLEVVVNTQFTPAVGKFFMKRIRKKIKREATKSQLVDFCESQTVPYFGLGQLWDHPFIIPTVALQVGVIALLLDKETSLADHGIQKTLQFLYSTALCIYGWDMGTKAWLSKSNKARYDFWNLLKNPVELYFFCFLLRYFFQFLDIELWHNDLNEYLASTTLITAIMTIWCRYWVAIHVSPGASQVVEKLLAKSEDIFTAEIVQGVISECIDIQAKDAVFAEIFRLFDYSNDGVIRRNNLRSEACRRTSNFFLYTPAAWASACFAYGYSIVFLDIMEWIDASESLKKSVSIVLAFGNVFFLLMFVQIEWRQYQKSKLVALEILEYYQYHFERHQDRSVKLFNRQRHLTQKSQHIKTPIKTIIDNIHTSLRTKLHVKLPKDRQNNATSFAGTSI